MKNKKITIDDLARMIQRGFEETAKKADVDKRFEQIDKRFEQVDKRFDNLEGQINNIDNKVNQIDRRLFSIEEDISEIKIKQYGDLLKRVNFIERKLGIVSGK